MRRVHVIASGLLLAAPLAALPAQIRWNDRPAVDWLQEAPRVRVWIDGSRFVPVGYAPMVRVEVSDDAYVVVGKVDSWGQLQILFPYSRGQRNTMIAGNMPRLITNPLAPPGRSFVVGDQWGGFIFAIASYSPIDMTALENRDFRPTGIAFSHFTLANRQLRLHPQQYIGNFATHVLWDGAIPYDYDYDFYSGFLDWGGYGSALAYCTSTLNRHFLFGDAFYFPYGVLRYGSYRNLCGGYLNSLRCIGLTGFYSVGSCYLRRPNQYTDNGPLVPGRPVQGTPDGKAFEGLNRTDSAKARAQTRYASVLKPPGGNRVLGDEPSEWDGVYSIPRRAITKLKQKELRPDATGGGEIAGGEFDLSRFRRASGGVQPPRRDADMTGFERPSRPDNSTRDFESPSRVRRTGSNGATNDAPRFSRPRRQSTKPASGTVVKPGKSAPTIKATRSPSSGTKSSAGKSSGSGKTSNSGKTSSTKKPPQP